MRGPFVDPNLRREGLDTSWLQTDPFARRYNVKPAQQVLTCTALTGRPP